MAGLREGRVKWASEAPLRGQWDDSLLQAMGWGGPGAVMSSWLALASLTHAVKCCVRKTDPVAVCQAAQGREAAGHGGRASAVR